MKHISIISFFIIYSIQAFSQEGYSGTGTVTGSTVTTIKDPSTDEDIEVTVQFINGKAVLDGDIILGPAENFSSGRGGVVTSDRSRRWPGVIPYFIQTALPQADKDKIHEAERILESQTNLRLNELTSPPASGTDYINFIVSTDGICAAHGIGNTGGENTIEIASGYRVGTFMHEILHKVGFFHEQNRTGRDTYVTVHFDNIIDNAENWKAQYRRIRRSELTALSGYDYESIMHYGSMASSRIAIDPSRPVITAISTNATERARLNALMGNRTHLSAMDIRSVNALFPTAPADAPASGPTSGGTATTASDNIPESIVSGSSATQSVSYTFPGASTPTQVTVNVVESQAILDGDIILGTMEELGGGRGGAAIGSTDGGTNRRWPSCTIPYDINNHPCSTQIRTALRTVDSLTNLTLIPRTSQANYIQFVVGTGYSSPVGMQNGRANRITISATGGCPTGKIMHETLHSAGLFHEQSRADRNTYVRLNTANLKEGMIHNFQTYLQSGQSGTDIGPYDYESIMHYPSVIGDSRMVVDMTIPVLTSIPPGKENQMGQRSRLSAGDIRSINSIYTCGSTPAESTGGTAAGDISTGREHSITLIPQGTNYSSFDACTAMMISWLMPSLLVNPAEISSKTGFWNQFVYNSDPALPISYVQWGIEKLDPKQYTPREFFSLVNATPVVVVPFNSTPGRPRLVYGMRGNGTPEGTIVMFHDGLDRDKTAFASPNSGYTASLSYKEFMTLLGTSTIIVGKY